MPVSLPFLQFYNLMLFCCIPQIAEDRQLCAAGGEGDGGAAAEGEPGHDPSAAAGDAGVDEGARRPDVRAEVHDHHHPGHRQEEARGGRRRNRVKLRAMDLCAQACY